MSKSITFAAESNQKIAFARRQKSVDNRLKSAVAMMDMLERRQLFSVGAFANVVLPGSGQTAHPASYASVIADVNGDGIPDLVVADSDGYVSIFLGLGTNGRGTGKFVYSESIKDGLGNSTVAQGDLVVATLQNGHPDILMAASTSGGAEGDVSILFGDGHGGFRQNGDGGQYFLYGATNGAEGGDPGFVIDSIAVADVNNDGVPDIITSDDAGQINVLLGTKTHGSYFPNTYTYQVVGGFDNLTDVAVADVNGDGLPDIVYLDSSAGTVNVLLHSTEYYYAGTTQPFYNATAQSANNGPYNKNVIGFTLGYNAKFQLPELVTVESTSGGNNQVSVLLGDYNANIIKNKKSDTVFGAYQTFKVASTGDENYVQLAFGDVNGDGVPDLLITQFGQDGGYTYATVTGIEGSSKGYLDTSTTFSKTFDDSGAGYYVQSLTFGDVNGDGLTDLSVTYSNSGGSQSNNYTYLSSVAIPPAFTSAPDATFLYGVTSSFVVTTTGSPPAALTVDDPGDLPPGVTLTDDGNGTATLTGIPEASGVFTFTLDAGDDVTQNFTLTVDQAPRFDYSTQHVTFHTGEYSTFFIGASGDDDILLPGFPGSGGEGGGAETISIENGSLPPGMTFVDSGSGGAEIFGTPAPTAGGVYDLVLIANNDVAPAATQELEIIVDQPPVFTSADSVHFASGVFNSFTVSTTGFPDADLSATGLPAGLSFDNNGDGTATISGTPTASEDKTYGITLEADNDAADVFQSLKITISPSKGPTITSANKASFQVGLPGSFMFKTTGFPTDTLTLTGDTLPTGVTFMDNGNGTGSLVGTPVAGTGGVYFETLTASNGSPKNAVQNFTLTVNQTLVITSAASTTFTVGSAGTFEVVTTGFPDGKLSVSGLPSGLKFHDNGNGTGTISGTPSANTGKSYKVTVSATNANGNVKQTLTLQVEQLPSLKSPTATYNLTEDKAYSSTIALAGFPTPISISDIAGLPSGLSLTTTSNGTALLLSGTATATGNSAVTFTLTNDDGGSSDLTIHIHVTGSK